MITGDPEKDKKIREAIGMKPASPLPRIIEVPAKCRLKSCPTLLSCDTLA